MPEVKPTVEEAFRSTLEDVALIATKLSPYCSETKDLVGMIQLALENDGQLKLLINLVSAQQGKR